MSHTLTIRLTDELLARLKETSRKTGIPVGRLVRQQLETARLQAGTQRFLRHGSPCKAVARRNVADRIRLHSECRATKCRATNGTRGRYQERKPDLADLLFDSDERTISTAHRNHR